MAIGNKHAQIVAAIQQAEKNTSGEIRVHISRRFFETNALKHCEKRFYKLKMHCAPERNGVLLYINTRRRKIAIFGDLKIHEKVGQLFWDEIIQNLSKDLKSIEQDKAISQAVLRMGEVLTAYFPIHQNKENPNQLEDDVTSD